MGLFAVLACCLLLSNGFVSVRQGDVTFVDDVLNFNTLGPANPVPRVIHFPESTEDVSSILRALPQGSSVAVRAGRHSYALLSVGNDVVIDVSKMKDIVLNGDQTATFQAGVKNYQVQSQLWKAGFMIPIGTCPSVGGGFFLGGGYSLASRWLGMGIDSITRFEVVLATGEIVTADSSQNADLFWALRGAGGGNYGVVTRVTIRLTPLPPAVSLMRFEWTDGAVALPVWEKFLTDNIDNDRLVPQGYTNFNGGARGNIFYFGPLAKLKALVGPLKAAGVPKSFSEKEVPYKAIMHQFAGCKDPETVPEGDPTSCHVFSRIMPRAKPTIQQEQQSPWAAASAYISRPIGAKWGVFMAKLKSLRGVIAILDPHGGAANRIPQDATAYAHRDALFHIQLMAYFTGEAGRPRAESGVKEMYEWLDSNGLTSGAYVNYPNFFMLQKPDVMTRYYGINFPRLATIKQRYDPMNVFSHPFGIVRSNNAQRPAIAAPAVAAPVNRAPAEASNSLVANACSEQIQSTTFRLVEVQTGATPKLETTVTICVTNGRLNAKFFIQELSAQPAYLTAGCNDNVNPPYKSNAVEAFLGFADDQASLQNYLEVETMPLNIMWIANIRYVNGKMVGSSALLCDQSGVSTNYQPDPKRPGWFTYDLSIPLATIPGYGKFRNLYGTFLRIAHVDTTFKNAKELSAVRSHGARNFHVPSRFVPIALPSVPAPFSSISSSSAAVPPPRVNVPASSAAGSACVTDRALAKEAQAVLIAKGVLKPPADGIFGRGSLAGLNVWLQRNKLAPATCLTEAVRQILIASRNN